MKLQSASRKEIARIAKGTVVCDVLLVAGLLYVIEALSVVLQVSYFKLTHGKRLFKMAPIHHHFEMCGWSEVRVVITFWIFTLICCLAGLLIV